MNRKIPHKTYCRVWIYVMSDRAVIVQNDEDVANQSPAKPEAVVIRPAKPEAVVINTPHVNRLERTQNSHIIKHAPEQENMPLALALFYVPVAWYLIVVSSVMEGGDDDALGLGILLPIVGFMVGVVMYNFEFLKGFGLHLIFSIGYAFIAYFLVIIGFLGDLHDGPPIILVFVVSFIMPIRNHMKNNHSRAIGALYAIPLAIWFVIIGLLIGWIQVDGLWWNGDFTLGLLTWLGHQSYHKSCVQKKRFFSRLDSL